MQTVYEAAGGYQGLLRLAHAWHARVMADELVSHAFSHGFHPDHSERLAAYWAEALGGPTTFSAAYGDETSVVRLHSGNGPHEEMDRRAIACFDRALEDVGGPRRSGHSQMVLGWAAALSLDSLDDHVLSAGRQRFEILRVGCEHGSARLGDRHNQRINGRATASEPS